MLERVAVARRTLSMSQTTIITRLPEGICGAHRMYLGLGFRFRTPAVASLVSRAYAAHAVRGAIKALDAPGNPFTVESLK